MKLINNNKEDVREWKLLDTVGNVSVYEEVLLVTEDEVVLQYDSSYD